MKIKISKVKENERKFRELVLYISQKCASDPMFGATKLNKVLFYSDFLAYANLGQPITGFEYQKLPNGPVPRRLLPVRDKMVEQNELGIQEVLLKNGYIQKRTVNLRPPDLRTFSAQEISLVDQVIEALGDASAGAVSELSYRQIGWIVADDGETIPYSTVCLSNEPLTETETRRAQELAATHGLVTA